MRETKTAVTVLGALFLAIMTACSTTPAAQVTPGPSEAPAPVVEEKYDTGIKVADQDVSGGKVILDVVTAEKPGFVALYAADAKGNAGSLMGVAAVAAGTSKGVKVDVEAVKASDVIYAKLFEDAGVAGAFDKDDPIVKFDFVDVAPAFMNTAAKPDAGLFVADQDVSGGKVKIETVIAPKGGFVTIWAADAKGNAATVIGFAPVKAGQTKILMIDIDAAKASPVIYAKLHEDAGVIGTYEPTVDPVVKNDFIDVAPAFMNVVP